MDPFISHFLVSGIHPQGNGVVAVIYCMPTFWYKVKNSESNEVKESVAIYWGVYSTLPSYRIVISHLVSFVSHHPFISFLSHCLSLLSDVSICIFHVNLVETLGLSSKARWCPMACRSAMGVCSKQDGSKSQENSEAGAVMSNICVLHRS